VRKFRVGDYVEVKDTEDTREFESQNIGKRGRITKLDLENCSRQKVAILDNLDIPEPIHLVDLKKIKEKS
jgi:hypothetical protein